MIPREYAKQGKSPAEKVQLVIAGVAILGLLAIAIGGYPSYQPLPQITSIAAAGILNAVGIFSAPWGDYLVVADLPPLKISAECSGIVLLLIFPLTIFLIPIFPIHQRLASLLFVPILFVGNILRIVTDVLIGKFYSPDFLLLYHDSLGQVFIFFWGIMAYLAWLWVFGNFPRDWVVDKIEKFGRFK